MGVIRQEVTCAKKRLQVYAADETIRRIELAAQKHNLPVSTYCLIAIQHQLEEDGVAINGAFAEANQSQFQALINEMRELQTRTLQERGGQPIDVDSLLEDLRDERDEEALGLRKPLATMPINGTYAFL